MCTHIGAADDAHGPVLTVGETFRFAARCGGSEGGDVETEVDSVLAMLGLSHVKETVVGDENLRGVSGGEKRRVTVGEMLFNPGCKFLCCDNITDGLASTDSLTIVQNLKGVCRKEGYAAVISLLQPSDEIVRTFDKLCVLTSCGEMSYFGPMDVDALRSVYSQKGEGEEEDDTGTLVDLVLSPSGGGGAGRTKRESLACQRYRESDIYGALTKSLLDIRSSAPPARERDLSSLLPQSPYRTTLLNQFSIVSGRRYKLTVRNPMTYTRPVIALVFGIVVGSLFSTLRTDLIGSLGRTGYVFLNCFLVLMLSAAVTIPDGFRQRPALFKHRTARFFSDRVGYVSQVMMDMPVSILEAVLMSVTSYFWVGMNPGVDHFFFFVAVLIGLEFVGQSFGRMVCAMSPTQVLATTVSTLYIFVCGAMAGFMPNYGAIPWILRWLSWATPVSYAFEALMLNEFMGRSMYGMVLVDGEEGDTNIGMVEGADFLEGAMGLPRKGWTSSEKIKFFDLGMLFAWAFFFDICGFFFSEVGRDWFNNQIRRPQPKVREREEPSPDNVNVAVNESEPEDDFGDWPLSLSVRDLTYEVPLKGGKGTQSKRINLRSLLGTFFIIDKNLPPPPSQQETDLKEPPARQDANRLTLLHGITARFVRGEMTALMGQSGAGKTTLLDVIAGYKTGGTVKGQIYVGSQLKDPHTWKQISGYAEQNDILNPYLSVLETLRFTASCRLTSKTERERRSSVDQVIDLMDLGDYRSSQVGREMLGEGLPKHVRKRLTIAVQLVVRPRILFLDEPTTGLGANAAATVVGAVRKVTDAWGLITLATIHQPSRKMFEEFDALILLAKGGRLAYTGPLGLNSATLMEYFSSVETPSRNVNPADHVLGILDRGREYQSRAVASFTSSKEYEDLHRQISVDTSQSPTTKTRRISQILTDTKRLQSSSKRFRDELSRLISRQALCGYRNPSYSLMRMAVSVLATLFLATVFFSLDQTIQGAVHAIAAIFFLVFVLVIPMQAAVVPLVEDRSVLYRETVSGTYSHLTYGLGQLIADLPFHAINAALMMVCAYYLMGFRTGAEYEGYFFFMLFLANWVILSMGQSCSRWSRRTRRPPTGECCFVECFDGGFTVFRVGVHRPIQYI